MAGLGNFTHRLAVNVNRRLGHHIFAGLAGPGAYDAIRRSLPIMAVSAADFTCPAPYHTQAAAALLDKYGVVVLPGLVDPALAAAARREADGFIAGLRTALTGPGDTGVWENVFWQVGGARFASYRLLEAHDQPVANLTSRAGDKPNAGIIDIFRINQAARRNGWHAIEDCCGLLSAPPVADLVGTVSPRRPAQFHMLRNDSVTNTRGLHVDNLNGFYKAFLYLSPVRAPDDGAYAYVPRTNRHLDLIRREARLNSLTGRREMDSFAFAGDEIPILGEPGTVIVSCQDGVHRGLPQRQGASRTMLVCNYHG